MRRGRRLGIDVGSVRIGVAVCDPDGMVATPLATVDAGPRDLDELADLVAEVEPIELVLGLPRSLNGRESHAAVAAREFAGRLVERFPDVPVRLFDERLTTTAADTMLRQSGRSGRSRRRVIDQAAAAMILQGCLDAERARGSAPGETVRGLT